MNSNMSARWPFRQWITRHGKIACTISEATERIGVGRSTIYKLSSRSKLTPRKLGKRTLIIVEELDAARDVPSDAELLPMGNEERSSLARTAEPGGTSVCRTFDIRHRRKR